MKLTKGAALTASILALCSWGHRARAERPSPPSVAKHLDFDDDHIEGDVIRPDDALVGGTMRPRSTRLIRIRANFLDELIRSTEDR